MKKVISLIAALAMVFSLTVSASATSSKTVNDLTYASSDGLIVGVMMNTKASLAAIEELSAADSISDFFAGAVDADGEEVDLTEFLGTKYLKINELSGLKLQGYTAGRSGNSVRFQFPTEYAEGEKVAVLIGIFYRGSLNWTVFEGWGMDDKGVMVKFTSDILTDIEKGDALIAIISQ